jgi:alkanesulfonate monooxygenase SsuD/methylene tetrahydromethanopterin reductase-like flavin-dependent oxidoreductase (luciferase family)
MEQRPESPHLSLRPTPLDPDRLLNSFHAAWGSAGSAPGLASQGLRPLIIPQRPATEYEKELKDFYAAGASAGYEPESPIVAQWAYCSTDRDAVERGREAFMANMECAELNYEFSKNYRGYPRLRVLGRYGKDSVLEDAAADVIIGSPDECIKKIEALSDMLHPKQFNFMFKYGNPTNDEAEKSIRLFATEVLPHVKKLEIKEPKVG